MGAWPDPGFPACPGTGPAKTAQAVGGGRSLARQAQLLSLNPRAGKCRALYPQDKQGELISVTGHPIPSSLTCTCRPRNGLSFTVPHGGGKRPVLRCWGVCHVAPDPRFARIQWCSGYSVLGRKAWFTSLISSDSDLIELGWGSGISN